MIPATAWYAAPILRVDQVPCRCSQPRHTRLRSGRQKIYIDANARPIFLKPSETAEFTPEELVEYRKSWSKP